MDLAFGADFVRNLHYLSTRIRFRGFSWPAGGREGQKSTDKAAAVLLPSLLLVPCILEARSSGSGRPLFRSLVAVRGWRCIGPGEAN